MTDFTGEVYDFADMLPMLPADRLQELAEDIRDNGQLFPILLSPEGVLLDGRNRLAACELAGIEPKFETYELDPDALVVSANAVGRQLSAGQRAMVVAVGMWRRGEWDAEAGRWKQGAVKRATEVLANTKTRTLTVDIANCGTVLAYSQELATDVLKRSRPLRATYDHVKTQQAQAEDRRRRWTELETNAPDLLSLLDDDFTFDMAYVAYLERDKERIAAERDLADAKTKYVTGIYGAVYGLSGHLASDQRRELLGELDLTGTPEPITRELIDQAITVLRQIREKTNA